MPPGYSLNWGGNGDYDGGASRLTLTDLRGVTFIQDCFDGKGAGGEGVFIPKMSEFHRQFI